MEEYQKLTIKEWAIEDRPREKMLVKGLHALTDAELIAILIGSGSNKESAVELSKKILRDHQNNLALLGKCSVDDLKRRYHGIGEAKAVTIVSALEIGRRRNWQESIDRPKITSSRDVFQVFGPMLGDLPHEEFWILMLNRSNKVIGHHRISQGGITGTVTDIRMVMRKALESMSTSIILCHNHPSGSLQPSKADIDITKKLSEAGKVMDIPVLDHLIVAENNYFSFADEGMV
ncbi:MAG: DNA repair protein RadC [Breznakibacter sp.]